MTTDQMKNKLENMPTKQKIMMVITLIVVLIVIWQVVGLFGSPSTPPTTINPAPVASNMSANAPGAQTMKPMAQNMTPNQAPMGTLQQPPQVVVPKEVPISKDQTQEEQDKVEKKYLKQLNDLEQLKLERQIEETNQAIATAKLATVTAEKSTADLLTKPAVTVPEGAYANQLVSPTRSGAAIAEGPPVEQVPPPPSVEPAIPDVAYTVISVSMQLNKWTAVIGAQGKLYSVSVGDTLPPDGSVVTSINKNGVTLRKDNIKRKINMTTAI
jgi:hypothetical protein